MSQQGIEVPGDLPSTKAKEIKTTGELIFINTYPVTLRNGLLVHDEWTAALFAAGYEVVRKRENS